MRIAMLAHSLGLVSAQPQIRAWFAGAYQSETGLVVLLIVAAGVRVVECTGEDLHRTGEIPLLLTEARKI